jgi:hypothetical protein
MTHQMSPPSTESTRAEAALVWSGVTAPATAPSTARTSATGWAYAGMGDLEDAAPLVALDDLLGSMVAVPVVECPNALLTYGLGVTPTVRS